MEILKVDMDGVKLNAPRYPTVFTNQIPTSTFIECNYTRAKQFHYRYPLVSYTRAKQFHYRHPLLSYTRAKQFHYSYPLFSYT